MAINLTNLFTALGRIGNNAYIIDSTQSTQAAPFNDLIALSYVNPTWLSTLIQNYDALIRTESQPQSTWSLTAQTILQAFVTADNPSWGTTLSASLQYLLEQMQNQSASVQSCTITSSVVADALNVGTPAVYVLTTRADGLIYQNTIAEVGSLVFTDDAYTGSATVNQEPWQWSGAPNISSLGTGTPVGLWDWDWPRGSNSTMTGNNIDAAQDATASGNYLTNGDMGTWSGSPAKLDNWYLATGTWGTDIKRSSAAAGLDGGYALEFVAGTGVSSILQQQFNSDESDPTVSTAGTDVALTAYRSYVVNLWIKRSGVVSGGVLRVSLVDSSGTTISDNIGTPNSGTITLSGITTSYVAYQFSFRLPVVTPSDGIIRLRLTMSSVLTGANVLVDYIAMAQPTQLYSGGPSLISFANPSDPVEAGPNPDGWSITFTNNRGGASYGATMQTLINRLFQTPELILPYSSTPTISDGLITSGITFPTTFELFLPRQCVTTVSGVVQDTTASAIPYTFQVVQAISIDNDISSIIGKIEESTTGVGAWTDVVGGTFANPLGADDLQSLVMTRTKRYIRYTCTIVASGGSPLAWVSATGNYY